MLVCYLIGMDLSSVLDTDHSAAFTAVFAAHQPKHDYGVLYLSEKTPDVTTNAGQKVLWESLANAYDGGTTKIDFQGVPQEAHLVAHSAAAHLREARELHHSACSFLNLSCDSFLALERLSHHDGTLKLLYATLELED
jgi:hypothetical protein